MPRFADFSRWRYIIVITFVYIHLGMTLMATTMVRVSDHARQSLRIMTAETGLSTPQLLDQIIEAERRRMMFDQADAAHAALQADPAAWEEERSERWLWDTTSADGLELDDLYEPSEAPTSDQDQS